MRSPQRAERGRESLLEHLDWLGGPSRRARQCWKALLEGWEGLAGPFGWPGGLEALP